MSSGSDSPPGTVPHRRRRAHRSRSPRKHAHRRHHSHEHHHTEVKLEDLAADRPADLAFAGVAEPWAPQQPPAIWGGASPGNRPPTGWHGSAGPPVAAASVAQPQGLLPHGHVQDGQEELHGGIGRAPGFAAVPPPPSLDSSSGRKGKGKKGKGRGGALHDRGPQDMVDGGPRMSLVDGLVVANIPPELNNLKTLHAHFRQFGEIMKINTSTTGEGTAFVQFADRIAAEAALTVQVLGRPDITTMPAPRPNKGNRGKGGKEGKGKFVLDRPAENRVYVTDPEEQHRLESSKRKRDEVTSRRSMLLGGLTEQMKVIMNKLADENVPEAKKESFRELLIQIRAKMSTLSSEKVPRQDEANIVAPSAGSHQPKGKGKSVSEATWEGGRWTLDLRAKAMIASLPQGMTLERLRDQLKRLGVKDDNLVGVYRDPVAASTDGDEPDTVEPGPAFVRFTDRWAAEQLYSKRGDLPFPLDWCDNPPPAPKRAAPPPPTALSSAQAAPAAPAPPPARAPSATAAPKCEVTPKEEQDEEARPIADVKADLANTVADIAKTEAAIATAEVAIAKAEAESEDVAKHEIKDDVALQLPAAGGDDAEADWAADDDGNMQ